MYDPTTGRFNRLDPFAGNVHDPQSLHKHAYVHGDPVNGIDPLGLWTVGSVFVASANVFRGIINLQKGFDAHWGVGHALATTFDYASANDLELAELHRMSMELMLMDIRSEMARGISVAAQASNDAMQTIEELMEANTEILFDAVLGPFFSRACFTAGTPVVINTNPDGTYVTKPIEDIRPGDLVLTRTENDERSPSQLSRVEEVFSRETDTIRVVEIADKSGYRGKFRTTDGHPFWVYGQGWTSADELQVGDRLSDPHGKRDVTVTSNESIELDKKRDVYTFHVSDNHTYFVADAIGIARLAAWVHNACRSQSVEYENKFRLDKGIAANQARSARQFSGSTKSGKRFADAIFGEGKIGGEAKYVSNWAKSIYNPASKVGSREFAKAVRKGIVNQARDYLNSFEKLVIRSNSAEFIAEYRRQFAAAGLKMRNIIFEHVPLH